MQRSSLVPVRGLGFHPRLHEVTDRGDVVMVSLLSRVSADVNAQVIMYGEEPLEMAAPLT